MVWSDESRDSDPLALRHSVRCRLCRGAPLASRRGVATGRPAGAAEGGAGGADTLGGGAGAVAGGADAVGGATGGETDWSRMQPSVTTQAVIQCLGQDGFARRIGR